MEAPPQYLLLFWTLLRWIFLHMARTRASQALRRLFLTSKLLLQK